MNEVEAHLITAAGDPYQAARVSLFMRDHCPIEAPDGSWRLVEFEIDAEHASMDRMKAAVESAPHAGIGAERWVPPGKYVSLQRHNPLPDNPRDRLVRVVMGQGSEWQTLMSDTPDEINDHEHVIEHATGRVLIHGLGIGCVIAALHVKPEVEHIDVVEIDPEVIAMTGHFYADLPKVNLVQGDAMTYEWPKGARWDYVWHDIWAAIAEDNLDAEEAEYGISYGMMFERFKRRADMQGAWGFAQAVQKAQRSQVEKAEAKTLMGIWPTLSLEEKENIAIEGKFKSGVGDPTAGQVREMANHDESWGKLVDECKAFAANKKELEEIEALMLLGYARLPAIVL